MASLLSLPGELILKIILHTPDPRNTPLRRRALTGIYLCCRTLCARMSAMWPAVVAAHTSVEETRDDVCYYFCDILHRLDGPAMHDGVKQK
jgi:hypothetical protein